MQCRDIEPQPGAFRVSVACSASCAVKALSPVAGSRRLMHEIFMILSRI
jgi:hypothetical protein